MIRLFDIFLSIIAILSLSPLLIICTFILKLTGEGEVFYFQERVGKNQKTFKLIKFATMLKNSEKMGSGTLTIRNDPRVLPFGKFLRISKINELPQLINILIGDMSVIGPRPLLKKQFLMYSEKDIKIISSISPGLSGVGSIVFRDEEELLSKAQNPHKYYEEVIAPYKAYLEKWYVKNIGINLYFKIIIVTLIAITYKFKYPEKLISSELRGIHDYKRT